MGPRRDQLPAVHVGTHSKPPAPECRERRLRFSRCRKQPSWRFPYLTKSRNLWEMRTTIPSPFEAASNPRDKPTISPFEEFHGLEEDRKTPGACTNNHRPSYLPVFCLKTHVFPKQTYLFFPKGLFPHAHCPPLS